MTANFKLPNSKNIARFWQLVVIKVRFNLKSDVSKSYLSYAWWVFEPLLQMMVFYVVFEKLLHRGTKDFIAFLLCGIIPWLWFSKSVMQSGNSILQGKGLISQTYLPKHFFPLVAVGQALVKQTFVFILLFAFLFVFHYLPSIGWLWLVPIVLVELLLITAVSFVFAFVVPFARDIRYLIEAGIRMLFFCSGIFYSYKQVLLPEHRKIFLMNPMANLIANYRRVLMENAVPMTGSLLAIAVVSVLIIIVMSRVMKHYDNTLTRLALE